MYLIEAEGAYWHAESVKEAQTFAAEYSRLGTVCRVCVPAKPASHRQHWRMLAVFINGKYVHVSPGFIESQAMPDIHHAHETTPRARDCMALVQTALERM